MLSPAIVGAKIALTAIRAVAGVPVGRMRQHATSPAATATLCAESVACVVPAPVRMHESAVSTPLTTSVAVQLADAPGAAVAAIRKPLIVPAVGIGAAMLAAL